MPRRRTTPSPPITSLTSMSRRNKLAIAAVATLGLLLAVAPLLPRGGHDEGAITPSGEPVTGKGRHGTGQPVAAGRSRVTPAMRAEIDRVVAQGRQQPAFAGRPTPGAAVAAQLRCATFAGLRYCLHVGWTDATQSQVRARTLVAAERAARPDSSTLNTGDQDVLTTLSSAAAQPPAARAAAERAELTEAARAVGKVWQLRHDLEGVPYPPGFLARHPEVRTSEQAPTVAARAAAARPTKSAPATPTPTSPSASATSTSAPTTDATHKTAKDYPDRDKILDPADVAEQTRTYWCGPTSMQMIAWGWKGRKQGQLHWARKIGTTTSGSDISAIVSVINSSTGWDRPDHAGPYITLDVGDWRYHRWFMLVMRHIHDYRAPILMHPILLKRYFPYLDDDASGHYQVGRGYDKRGDKPNQISYFEPWNQQRFDPSEPYIARVQWRSAYRSYRANEAHPAHNIGV